MNKIICDKCKKEIEFPWRISGVRETGGSLSYSLIPIDLCEKCWEEVSDFIFGKDEI